MLTFPKFRHRLMCRLGRHRWLENGRTIPDRCWHCGKREWRP